MSKYAYFVWRNQETKGHSLNFKSSEDINNNNIISCIAFIMN